MRIIQIVPSVSLVYGGPSQMVLGLSAALAAEGIEVSLLTTNANGDAGQAPLDVPLAQPLQQDGYKIFYFPCSPFQRYKFSLGLLQWLRLHGREYDLVHIHALFSPISTAAAYLARSLSLPYILRPLGTLDPADLRKKRWLKQVYGFLWEKPNLAGAAAIHFTSQQEAKISERFGATTQDLVIPLGVKLPEKRPVPGQIRRQLGIAENCPLLLFLSRLDPKKGLDLLIPALEQLKEEGLDFHFVLAGSNPQDPDYEQGIGETIRVSALASRTTITGFVTGDMKLGLLQDADLFVLPSYYENFGIAVAEAMTAGTAVVISDQVHIWQEVSLSKAGWVSTCEVNDFAAKLRLGLADEDEREKRGLKGKNYALEHYSWQAIALQTIAAYRLLFEP